MNRGGAKPSGGMWRLLVLIARAVQLRCPACGRGKLFRGWFTMHDACPECGRRFGRGPGFFIGSIYFNYGVTAVLVIVLYFTFFFTEILSDSQVMVVLTLVAFLFPLLFFRFARSLWVAFDELWDPTTVIPTQQE
jgi:uncharacterized protein (DUF983 family)